MHVRVISSCGGLTEARVTHGVLIPMSMRSVRCLPPHQRCCATRLRSVHSRQPVGCQ